MIKYCLIILTAFLVFVSCTSDDMLFDIGKNKVDIRAHMVFVDTLTIHSYTVMQDSIKTSGLNKPAVVIGKYDDPEFGTVSASSFFRFLFSQTSNGTKDYNIPKNAEFDSIQIFINYNKYYIGDTLQPFTISVHRLKEAIKTSNEDFYNKDSIAAFSELFGQKTFKPRPNSSDTIFIPVDNNFGNEIFNYMKKNDVKVTEPNFFLEYFKGVMLRYGENNKSILGFKFSGDSYSEDQYYPIMRIYYHYIEALKVRYGKFDFPSQLQDLDFYKKRLQFNSFSIGNKVVNFPDNQRNKLHSNLTNNKSYIQGGIGIVTRLEFPYLRELFMMSNDFRVLHAELYIEPARHTYNNFELPKNVGIYYTNRHSNILSEIYDKDGYSQLPLLQIDEFYQEETWYKFDVTEFVNYYINQQNDDIPSLLISMAGEDLNKTTNRLVLGSQLNSQNIVKLKIYYMNIQ